MNNSYLTGEYFMNGKMNWIFWSCFLVLCFQANALEIGAWVGGPEGVTYPQPTRENVESFQNMQERHLDYISLFVVWDVNDWAWTESYAKVAEDNGSILLVTWMANGYNLDAIISGNADNYLKKYAQDVKDYGKDIWLRPLHEANGDWYDWGVGKNGANNTSEKCVTAWKHIVQIFRDLQVPNVKWVWTTNASNSGSGTSYMGAYPGDDWVDYNSIDGYNWGSAQSWSSWKSFSEVFSTSYNLLAKQNKPIFLAEFSSSEHGGDKAKWIEEMFADLPVKFPKIFALMWFSQSKSAEADWAVNTSDASLSAWKLGISNTTQNLQNENLQWQAIHQNGTLFIRALKDEIVQVSAIDSRGKVYFKKEVLLQKGPNYLNIPPLQKNEIVLMESAKDRTRKLCFK